MKKYTLTRKYIILFLLLLSILIAKSYQRTEHFVQGIINFSRVAGTTMTNTINQTQGYATEPYPLPWQDQYPDDYMLY